MSRISGEQADTVDRPRAGVSERHDRTGSGSNSPTGDYLEIEGFFDGIDQDTIIGWAWDEFDPSATMSVEIYHDGVRLATKSADEFRQDLLDAGKGDGRHAFLYHVPASLQHKPATDFRIKVAGTSVELFEAPVRFRLPKGEIPLPPKPLLTVTGHPDPNLFFDLGDGVATVCRKYGRLRPTGRVLDVGCGVGWLAIPLTKYLSSRARYEGIDIMPDVIHWCRENISLGYPNFNFQHADIYSRYYNPESRVKASEYVFPYESDAFDLVFLGSVFTHLLPLELEHYLSEIVRVLVKGARCLISYFLLENGALKYQKDKSADADFKFDGPGYRTTNEKVPEAAVAYEEMYVKALYARHGLRIIEPIHSGSQDLIVGMKETD